MASYMYDHRSPSLTSTRAGQLADPYSIRCCMYLLACCTTYRLSNARCNGSSAYAAMASTTIPDLADDPMQPSWYPMTSKPV
eukprot:10924380-Karenia_brevis.AAC.1